jgi:hypothetical protein
MRARNGHEERRPRSFMPSEGVFWTLWPSDRSPYRTEIPQCASDSRHQQTLGSVESELGELSELC